MPLYLDSADLDDIRKAMSLGFIAGVTSNPALMAKTGRPATAWPSSGSARQF